tara:strand:- start:24087 stop:24338 length:252 start_codon:yes stop_codon:yes gene_type:complete
MSKWETLEGDEKLTQKTDEEIMEEALLDFEYNARDKFLKGILEHNSDGTKGLARMKSKDLVNSIKEEIIDAWFYLAELERRIK